MIPENALLIPEFKFKDSKITAPITAMLEYSKIDGEILFFLPRSLFVKENSEFKSKIESLESLKLIDPITDKTIITLAKKDITIQYMDLSNEDQINSIAKIYNIDSQTVKEKFTNQSSFHEVIVLRFKAVETIKPIVFNPVSMFIDGDKLYYPVKVEDQKLRYFDRVKSFEMLEGNPEDMEYMRFRTQYMMNYFYFYFDEVLNKPMNKKEPAIGSTLLGDNSDYVGIYIAKDKSDESEGGKEYGIAMRPALIELALRVFNKLFL